MAIKKLNAESKPPRRWALIAHPVAGKSTFAMRMRGPLVVADIDGRTAEVHHLAHDVGVIQLDSPETDPAERANAWANQIAHDIAGEPVGTLIGDSITPVIEPLLYEAAMTEGVKERNKALLTKAAIANKFFNAMVNHSGDTLLIWHLKDTNVNGQDRTRTTLSETETDRLKMHLNAMLHIVTDKQGKRGIEIVWARNGRSGIVLWDDSGSWEGMPDKIEAHLYPQKAVAPSDLPHSPAPNLTTREEALTWSVKRGAFKTLDEATAAYEDVKAKKKPRTAGDMFQLWREHVESVMRSLAAA